MFQNNNNLDSFNVNTHFTTLYSDESMLTIGGWNKALSVKLHPSVGKDANGVTQYTRENTQIVKTSIRYDKAVTLLELYNKKVKDKVGTEESKSVSVEVSSNNITKMLTLGWDGKDGYFKMDVGLDANKIPTNTFIHKFAKKEAIEDYDSSTGSGTIELVESDLKIFVGLLEACKKLIPTEHHITKYMHIASNTFSQSRNNVNNGMGIQNPNSNGNNQSFPNINPPEGIEDYLPFNN